jgi:hypothetical protein
MHTYTTAANICGAGMSIFSQLMVTITGTGSKTEDGANVTGQSDQARSSANPPSSNRDLMVHLSIPALTGIPPHRKELLFVSRREPQGHGFGLEISIGISADGEIETNIVDPDDPSTIYECGAVRRPKQGFEVPELPYFPSYSGMTPEQRGLYLEWLCDISNPIDVGYVFVYYYGLERHLVVGMFDAAVDEILALRSFHSNSSFQSYSASALVHACLLRKRPDILQRLYTIPGFNYFGNSNLLALYHSGEDITPETLFQLACHLQEVNKRYLKLNPELYQQKLRDTLSKQFGKEFYPFASRFLLRDVDGVAFPVFANTSFPPGVRAPALPNFFRHGPFVTEFGDFFREVHESAKAASKSKKRAVT